ncbi:MAG: hypothetical protein RRZ67_04205 [Victivallaceae bacterium]
MIDKESEKIKEESERQKVLQYTSYYLENYLHPNKNWDRWVSPKERINRIRCSNVNWKTVSDHIKGMEYQDFLQTPYWKAITAYSKFKAGYRCQVCDSSCNLAVHHRNYAIHGFEHACMHELFVLCTDCHSKFHGQISHPKSKPKAKDSKFHGQISHPKSKPKAKVGLIIVLIIKLMVLSALIGHFLIEKYQVGFHHSSKFYALDRKKAPESKIKRSKWKPLFSKKRSVKSTKP